MILDDLMAMPQYSVAQADKDRLLLDGLNELTRHHYENCPAYHRLIDVMYDGRIVAETPADVPTLPVGLFKSHELCSVAAGEVYKTLTSSGTTGQRVSRVFLDRRTASLQAAALVKIISHVLGPNRLPMLLVETENLIKDPRSFSARGAGVMGMLQFGRDHTYVLDENMALDVAALQQFVERRGGSPFIIFGFTYMVWAYFYEQIKDLNVDLSNGILIHSGGWKKVQNSAVDNTEFKSRLLTATGIRRVYNFYGMVEQVGSVFLEDDNGLLYPPNFADVIVRDPQTDLPCATGTPGVVEVVSLLPWSYPGHAILTEDLGVIEEIDAQGAGRLGKGIRILGRIPGAELRGCSDTAAQEARS